MKKRIIDMEKDPRWEQYAYFAPLRDPYVGVTCRVDAAGWQKRRTASGAPAFLSLAYEILPVTIAAHHALADGIHLAAFFDELKRRLG